MPPRPDNDVVENFNLEQLPGPDQVAGDLYVGLGRFGLAARVTMLCGAPVYVQSPIGGAGIDGNSTGKGVLCMRQITPSDLSRPLRHAC